MSLRNILVKLIIAFMDSIRPFLGPRGVCIYHPYTCRKYVRANLQEKPIYLALPLIFLRLISCNPLTAIYWKVRHKKL
ncbi:membrane protein insertion efficiency factor YidD [Candidatus Dependentiae bacterium]|nr:membrane protein insertion efficiency factor YidD [Candidatus Dependentiae bacterium]